MAGPTFVCSLFLFLVCASLAQTNGCCCDSIGKNFAQMEMRTIMAHLFRYFTFELEEQTNEYKHLQKGNAFYGVVSALLLCSALPCIDIDR